MNGRGLALMVTMLLVFGPLPAEADDGISVAVGAELAFGRPQVDEAGLRAVIERTQFVDGVPCATVSQSRIVVLDLTEHCGHDVLREMPGTGADPSITADGATMGWRVENGSTHSFFFSTTDLGVASSMLPDDTADSVDHLEIQPDATNAFYWRQVGSSQQLLRGAVGSTSSITVLDSGASPLLSDHHPVSADGAVFYSKLVGAEHELYMVPSGTTTVLPVPGAWIGGDKTDACVSKNGSTIAFIDTFAGVANVFALVLGADPVQLTQNTSSATKIFEVDISPNGRRVVFSSNGDFVGANPDGSMEVFRAASAGGSMIQVSEFAPAVPALEWPHVRGLSIDGDGSGVLVGRGTLLASSGPGTVACNAFEHNSLRTCFYAPDVLVPPTAPTTTLVIPPFDVKTSFPGISLGCVPVGPSATRCDALVRESTEATRRLLVLPHWEFDTPCSPSINGQARPMTLAAGKQAVVFDLLETPPGCSGATGTFSLVVVSPDVPGADRAVATAPFTLP